MKYPLRGYRGSREQESQQNEHRIEMKCDDRIFD
jgi:hypothetical protein